MVAPSVIPRPWSGDQGSGGAGRWLGRDGGGRPIGRAIRDPRTEVRGSAAAASLRTMSARMSKATRPESPAPPGSRRGHRRHRRPSLSRNVGSAVFPSFRAAGSVVMAGSLLRDVLRHRDGVARTHGDGPRTALPAKRSRAPRQVRFVARRPLEALDDARQRDRRRIADQHVDVILGVAAGDERGAGFARLTPQNVGEPSVGARFEHGLAPCRRPHDVHEQMVVAVALNQSDSTCHTGMSTRRSSQLLPRSLFSHQRQPGSAGLSCRVAGLGSAPPTRPSAATALPRTLVRGSGVQGPKGSPLAREK